MFLDDLASHYWFPFVYKTGKLSRVGGCASIICKRANGTEGMNDGTKAIRPVYHEECLLPVARNWNFQSYLVIFLGQNFESFSRLLHLKHKKRY